MTFQFGKRSREDIVKFNGSKACSNESEDHEHAKLECRCPTSAALQLARDASICIHSRLRSALIGRSGVVRRSRAGSQARFVDYGRDVEPALRLYPEKSVLSPDDPPNNRLSPPPNLYISATIGGFVSRDEGTAGGQIVDDHFNPGWTHVHPRRYQHRVTCLTRLVSNLQCLEHETASPRSVAPQRS